MADIRIVPKEHWEIIQEYIGADMDAVVLIPEHVLDKFPEKDAAKLRDLADKGTVAYDFGGEPDIYLDIIRDPDSFAAGEILSLEDEGEEDADDGCY